MKSPAFKKTEEALYGAYDMLCFKNDEQQIVCRLCGARTKKPGDDLADMKHAPDCAFTAVAQAFDALLNFIYKMQKGAL